VHAVQALTFLLAALLTAVAVSLAGPIGFVGLVAPHLVRRTVSPDHRVLLPGSALAGGALLVLADTLARTVATPVQLPAGVLTALIGVPLFVALLTSEGRRHGG
jgi:iron complex transport system permease protein